MNILVIDSSCDSLTIALWSSEKLYSYKSMSARQGHSVMLLPAVDELLKQANISVNDVDCFSAVVGPGSFTGIRVGVATANAFAYANKKPLVSITTFEPFAYDSKDSVLAIDAKHGNYYVAKSIEGRLSYETVENRPLYENAKVLSVEDVTPESLLAIALKKAEAGEFVDILKPFYMRASEAERNKKQ